MMMRLVWMVVWIAYARARSCVGGEYYVFGDCWACPSGQYQNQPVQSSCKSCPGGKYSMHTKSSSCESCSEGKYHDTAFSSSTDQACVACPSGRISSPGQTSCGKPLNETFPYLQSKIVNFSNIGSALGLLSNSSTSRASGDQLFDVLNLLVDWASATLAQVQTTVLDYVALVGSYLSANDLLFATNATNSEQTGLLMSRMQLEFSKLRGAMAMALLERNFVQRRDLALKGNGLRMRIQHVDPLDWALLASTSVSNASDPSEAIADACSFTLPRIGLEYELSLRRSDPKSVGLVAWQSPYHWIEKGLDFVSRSCGLEFIDLGCEGDGCSKQLASSKVLLQGVQLSAENPIQIHFPIDTSLAVTTLPAAREQLQCVHWVGLVSEWSTTGCSLAEANSTSITCACTFVSSEYAVTEIPVTVAPTAFPTAFPTPSPTTYNGFEYKDDFVIVVVAAIGVGSVLIIMCIYHMAVKRLWASAAEKKNQAKFWSPNDMQGSKKREQPKRQVPSSVDRQKYLRGGGNIEMVEAADRDSAGSDNGPPDIAEGCKIAI